MDSFMLSNLTFVVVAVVSSASPDVRVDLMIAQPALRVRQPCVGTVRLTNSGARPIAVTGRSDSTIDLFLWCVVDDGKTVEKVRCTPRHHVDSVKLSSSLLPGESIEANVLLWCAFEKKRFLFPKAGRYDVCVEWRHGEISEPLASAAQKLDVTAMSAEDAAFLTSISEIWKNWLGWEGAEWQALVHDRGLGRATEALQVSCIEALVRERMPDKENQLALIPRLDELAERTKGSSLGPYLANFLAKVHLEQFDREIASDRHVSDRHWNDQADGNYQRVKDLLSAALAGDDYVRPRASYRLAELYLRKGILTGEWKEAEEQAALIEESDFELDGKPAHELLREKLEKAKAKSERRSTQP